MKSQKKRKPYETGSTNVFADLEMQDAPEKLVKAEMILKINQLIQKKKLTQKAAALLLQTTQSKISLLKRGRLSLFSIERLARYLTLLHQNVEIMMHDAHRSKNPGAFRVVHSVHAH